MLVTGTHGNATTFGGESFGRRQPQSLTGRGHQRNPIFQPEIHAKCELRIINGQWLAFLCGLCAESFPGSAGIAQALTDEAAVTTWGLPLSATMLSLAQRDLRNYPEGVRLP